MRALAFLVLPILATGTACIATHSFDGYDVSAFGVPRSVAGTVAGLDDTLAVTLTLESRGVVQTISAENGAYVFPTSIADGESYSVKATAPDGFVCTVANGFGIVAKDLAVDVQCSSDDTALAALSTSLGGLNPDLAIEISDYTVGPVGLVDTKGIVRTTVTVTAIAHRSDATVRIFGKEAVAKLTVAGALSPAVVPIEVTAKSGSKRTYHIALELGFRVKASPTEKYAQFGHAVAVSGDTIAVGARFGAGNVGSVDIYDKSSGKPVFVTHLAPTDPSVDLHFGSSVALEGDRLVVGAASLNIAQAVYVFERKNGVWAQSAKLVATLPDVDRQFGYRVALSGDTIAVGDPWDDSPSNVSNTGESSKGASNAGSVHVFHYDGASWTREAYLKGSHVLGNHQFGWAIALRQSSLFIGARNDSGDVNGADDSFNYFCGAAYVFTRSGSTWTQAQYLKPSNVGAVNYFGTAVAFDGTTLAIGAPSESSANVGVGGSPSGSLLQSGAIYLFQLVAGKYQQTVFVKPSNPHLHGGFGSSVALADGFMFVGAAGDRSVGVGVDSTDPKVDDKIASGSAYLFSSLKSWTQVAYIKPPVAEAGRFNDVVGAIGGSSFVIGQPYDPSTETDPLSKDAEEAGGLTVY
ncbi:hypothetical protein BH09MYX1_BH09MYX1_31050 [soil metagenome]